MAPSPAQPRRDPNYQNVMDGTLPTAAI